MKNILTAIFCAALLLAGCKKDIDEFIPDGNTPISGKVITTSIGGVITDENGLPLEGASVSAGDKTSVTDENGIFLISKARVNDDHTYVKVSHMGYFNGSRTLMTDEDAIHYVKIELLEKTNVTTFENGMGGVATFQDVRLTFPENSIAKNDGGTYSGPVHVAAKWLNPADQAIFRQMPGDLRGFTVTDLERGLATFGMIAVELSGENGEPLQVADGQEVEMSMPVPQSLVASAPSIIPLWYFDESDGFWKEEGSASLENGRYVGTVSHFSFWNCDAPFDIVRVVGRVVSPSLIPFPGLKIVVTLQSDPSFRGFGYTDNNGLYEGMMPKDEILSLQVIDECGNVVFTTTIGPFSSPVILPDIVLDPSSIQNAYAAGFKGSLVSCDDEPVLNGYIKFTIDNSDHFAFVDDTDGTFDFSYLTCTNSAVTYIGYDLTNLKQSIPANAMLDMDVDLGTIRACDDLDVYITYNMDGEQFTTADIDVFFRDNRTHITGSFLPDSITYIGFSTDGVTVGDFPIKTTPGFYNLTVNNIQSTSGDVTVTFTEFGMNTGDYVVGSFSGTFEGEELPPVTHTVSGSFRGKRR